MELSSLLRAIREAADRALAVAAKGRTKWSRRPRGVATLTASRPPVRKTRLGILRLKAKNLPMVQRKVRVLDRLVPECRKEALHVILEEATDYIDALEMQVRIMTNLTDLFTRSSSGARSSSLVHAAAVHSPGNLSQEQGVENLLINFIMSCYLRRSKTLTKMQAIEPYDKEEAC